MNIRDARREREKKQKKGYPIQITAFCNSFLVKRMNTIRTNRRTFCYNATKHSEKGGNKDKRNYHC
jgi:hypothetical protein